MPSFPSFSSLPPDVQAAYKNHIAGVAQFEPDVLPESPEAFRSALNSAAPPPPITQGMSLTSKAGLGLLGAAAAAVPIYYAYRHFNPPGREQFEAPQEHHNDEAPAELPKTAQLTFADLQELRASQVATLESIAHDAARARFAR